MIALRVGAAVMVLAGCQQVDRTPPLTQVELAAIPDTFKRRCPPLTVGRIPGGDQELRIVWPLIRTDLENYKVCRYRHGKLVEAIEARDAIQGAGR